MAEFSSSYIPTPCYQYSTPKMRARQTNRRARRKSRGRTLQPPRKERPLHRALPDLQRRKADNILARALICPFCTFLGEPSWSPSRDSLPSLSRSVVLVIASIL